MRHRDAKHRSRPALLLTSAEYEGTMITVDNLLRDPQTETLFPPFSLVV